MNKESIRILSQDIIRSQIRKIVLTWIIFQLSVDEALYFPGERRKL